MINQQQLENIFSNIETLDELETVYNIAKNFKFHLGDSSNAHSLKLQYIINNQNTFSLNVPSEFWNVDKAITSNYKKFEDYVERYFKQFDVNFAIKERIRGITVDSKYSNYPKTKTLDEVLNMGYKPHKDFKPEGMWHAIDLSKPTKIRYVGECYEFDRFLELIGGPQLPYFSNYSQPAISETDDYIIHPNRKVSFKNEELATKIRDLMVQKYENVQTFLIKKT